MNSTNPNAGAGEGTYSTANFESRNDLAIPKGGGSQRTKGGATVPYQKSGPVNLNESVPSETVVEMGEVAKVRVKANARREKRCVLGRNKPASVVTETD